LDGHVIITIHDLLGKVVSNLVNEEQLAGFNSTRWNATDDNGRPVSTGTYLVKIKVDEKSQTKKMVLIK
jgi:flagellar hook assembly protein FlgD